MAAAPNDERSIETESVYLVPGAVSPETITRSLEAILPSRHAPIVRHRFTVLDTFDDRVRRAGGCLTRSGANGATIMAWQPRGGGRVTVRPRQPVSFAWDLPDGPLQRALAPVIGVRRLLAQAEAEKQGSLLEILDDEGKTVARLRIESGRARLPMSSSAWHPLPTTLTLIGLRGYEEAFARIVPVIESRPGVEPCPAGATHAILRRVGVPERGDISTPRVDLAPTVRADVGARQIHRALLAILVVNEPGVRASLDTEFLHDFRVAVRRTRALLGQIKQVFLPEIAQHFSTEFSWIGRLTGPPRDLDVLVLALRERHMAFAADDMELLLAFLDKVQQHEHASLVRALDSERYRRLLSEWHSFLDRPGLSTREAPSAGLPLADLVSRRAWRLSRRIASSAATVDDQTPAERLHEVRIDAKKLRYLVDATSQFFDPADMQCILAALKQVQRVLGDFNDAHVQEKRLIECGRAFGAAGGPPGALMTLGRLAEQRHERGRRLHAQAVEKLAGFRSRDTRAACRRAFKHARAGEPAS